MAPQISPEEMEKIRNRRGRGRGGDTTEEKQDNTTSSLPQYIHENYKLHLEELKVHSYRIKSYAEWDNLSQQQLLHSNILALGPPTSARMIRAYVLSNTNLDASSNDNRNDDIRNRLYSASVSIVPPAPSLEESKISSMPTISEEGSSQHQTEEKQEDSAEIKEQIHQEAELQDDSKTQESAAKMKLSSLP